MNFAVGAAFNVKHLFENFNFKKLKMNCKFCKRVNNDNHRQALVYKIFRECVKVILNDCIDNNVTFELPTGGKKSSIHLKRFSGEEFKKQRRLGRFKDVDFLISNFSGYQLMLSIYSQGQLREKPIYVNNELKNKITENTNAGKQYC